MYLRLLCAALMVLGLLLSPHALRAQISQNMLLVGQIGGLTYAVAVQGGYAYVGVGPRLVILDIRNPARPTLVGQTAVLPRSISDSETDPTPHSRLVYLQHLWVMLSPFTGRHDTHRPSALFAA